MNKIINFFNSKTAIRIALSIGVIGLVTATFNFDPFQFIVSIALIISSFTTKSN